jgi:hypothetical protein
MGAQTVVLDTNVYRGAPTEKLAALRSRGVVVRVSDLALYEAWARSVREYREERMSRQQARGLLFARAKSVAPYLDAQTPIAATGGALARGVIAQVDGGALKPRDLRYLEHLPELWGRLIGVGLSDEEWIQAGIDAQKHLEELDANLFDLARREDDLRKNPVPDDVDPADLPGQYDLWDSLSDEQRFAAVRDYLKATWTMTDAVADRFDAHIAVTARRFQAAAAGARMPKRNDGTDAALTMHIAEGCILVTDEGQLIKLVDESKTYQRPWVRRLNDLEDLPVSPGGRSLW